MLSECNSGSNEMVLENDELKKQVLLNHFTNATGCSLEQAQQLLVDARWHFETALSLFFQETALPSQRMQNPLAGAPCNTPATPPSFTEALLALHKLQCSAAGPGQQQQSQAKVLAAANPPPRWDASAWPSGDAQSQQQFNAGMVGVAAPPNGGLQLTGENKWMHADDFGSAAPAVSHSENASADECTGMDDSETPVDQPAALFTQHRGSAPRPIFASAAYMQY